MGGIEQPEHIPMHPSLAIHELIKKLGNLVPQSPKDVTVMQRRLIRATTWDAKGPVFAPAFFMRRGSRPAAPHPLDGGNVDQWIGVPPISKR